MDSRPRICRPCPMVRKRVDGWIRRLGYVCAPECDGANLSVTYGRPYMRDRTVGESVDLDDRRGAVSASNSGIDRAQKLWTEGDAENVLCEGDAIDGVEQSRYTRRLLAYSKASRGGFEHDVPVVDTGFGTCVPACRAVTESIGHTMVQLERKRMNTELPG